MSDPDGSSNDGSGVTRPTAVKPDRPRFWLLRRIDGIPDTLPSNMIMVGSAGMLLLMVAAFGLDQFIVPPVPALLLVIVTSAFVACFGALVVGVGLGVMMSVVSRMLSYEASDVFQLFSVDQKEDEPPTQLVEVIGKIQQAFVFEESELKGLQARASGVRRAGYAVLFFSMVSLVIGPFLYLGKLAVSPDAIAARDNAAALETTLSELQITDPTAQQTVTDAGARAASLSEALAASGARDWKMLLAGSSYALVFLGIAAAVFKLEGRYTDASMQMRRRMSRFEIAIVSLKVEWDLGDGEESPEFKALVRQVLLELRGIDREQPAKKSDTGDIQVPHELATQLAAALAKK